MKWFDNPRKRRRSPSKRRKSRRRPPKGFSSWKAWSRAMRARIGKKGGSMARRKRSKGRKRTRSRRSSRRARAVVTVRSNPRRRHYRRRHNPRFSTRGIMSRVIQGAQDGIWIVGGKAVTNALPALIGLAPTGALGLGIKAVAAVASGYVFGMISPNAGKLATAAGFASIYEPFIRGLNIPIISPALADDDDTYGYASYPDEVGAGVGAYPEASVGDEDYAYSAYPQ
jgi:hypothetical protein